MKEHFLWTEIYRPKSVAECVLPARLRKTFQGMTAEGEIPNMLLSGPAGTGKTTIAHALCAEMGLDVMFVNASKDGNIDTLRNRIAGFSETISLISPVKVVILDEADYLNAQSTQPALRSFIESTSRTTRFILTCNFPNRIIEPLQSRLQVIDFSLQKKEKARVMAMMMKRVTDILDESEIPYEQKAVAELIMMHLPDFRKIISELQAYARSNGKIDSDVVFSIGAEDMDALIKILKRQQFKEMRQWVAGHKDFTFVNLLTSLKPKVLEGVVSGGTVVEAIDIMQDANKYATIVPDMDLHITHMFAMLMGLDWK